MKECDIFGVKTYSDPSCDYFQGIKTANPRIYVSACTRSNVSEAGVLAGGIATGMVRHPQTRWCWPCGEQRRDIWYGDKCCADVASLPVRGLRCWLLWRRNSLGTSYTAMNVTWVA